MDTSLVLSTATQGDVPMMLASVFAAVVGKPLLGALYKNPNVPWLNKGTIHIAGLVFGGVSALLIQYGTGTLEVGHIEGFFKVLVNAWGVAAAMTHMHETSKPVPEPQVE